MQIYTRWKISCSYALSLLLLAGCASTKGTFQTKKDLSYQKKVSRLLLAYFNPDAPSILGRDFSDRFGRRATALLAQKGVPCEPVPLQRQALDRNAPLRVAAARFRPTQVLWFAVTRVNTNSDVHRTYPGELPQFNSQTSVTLEFNLVDAQDGRAVWCGEAFFDLAPNPEEVAAQLIEQLAAAQLF